MTPLERAWEHYGGTLMSQRAGKNKAKCPLHEDANASASVDVGAQKWTCFAGCGYGDIYELIYLAEGGDLKFPELKAIGEREFGVSAPGQSLPSSTKSKKRPGRRKPAWVGD